ncbi:DNA-binding response regulator, AraC family [Fulvivirga imtechensis AK7]|uniref:DNA-binding response regulator, AraC family n=1 Tax=Fulvivirga imtechensis AK7 TaxID=1237149 RepID=L8JUE5_9BACT|nr:AraC family transcriptional regulator [Fulvivirga imtechensis]ELR71174.1 DNA-binding response regulator, AraC family [Fulvivirga imtechensis AK7]
MQDRINNTIRILAGRGYQLASTRLEKRRVKCLNIINLIMIPWLLSAGAVRLAAGQPILSLLDWGLTLFYIGTYFWHGINLKHPRILVILMSQLAVAVHVAMALSANSSPQPHLKISVVVLSFLILIFFEGALLYLLFFLNAAFFYVPYLLTDQADTISILHGTYLFLGPFFVVKSFFSDVHLYEKELANRKGNGRFPNSETKIATKHPIGHSPRDEKFLEDLSETVFKNIDNNKFSVTQLARELGMSRSQLYRKVYALTGKSISQFIKTKRLNYAYQLLESNDGTVSEIAYKSGFSSPNYFNKCFKKKYKINPGGVKTANICH